MEISTVSIFRPSDKVIFSNNFTVPISLSFKSYKSSDNTLYYKGALYYYHTKNYIEEYGTSDYRFTALQAEMGYQWRLHKLTPMIGLMFSGGWSSKEAVSETIKLYKNINTFHTDLILKTEWLYTLSSRLRVGINFCLSHKGVLGSGLMVNYAI